ncbi:MAG: hypothetical protein ACRDRL_33615 [Sciscionella sp.]
MTAPVVLPNTDAVLARWEEWARSGDQLVRIVQRQGHTDTALLCAARTSARREAARILTEAETTESAVAELMDGVARSRVISPPLFDFDVAMVGYTRARTLQACARELDHTITELQPLWT